MLVLLGSYMSMCGRAASFDAHQDTCMSCAARGVHLFDAPFHSCTSPCSWSINAHRQVADSQSILQPFLAQIKAGTLLVVQPTRQIATPDTGADRCDALGCNVPIHSRHLQTVSVMIGDRRQVVQAVQATAAAGAASAVAGERADASHFLCFIF